MDRRGKEKLEREREGVIVESFSLTRTCIKSRIKSWKVSNEHDVRYAGIMPIEKSLECMYGNQ